MWTRPLGKRTFGLSEQFAGDSKALAANQGLYNGFLAAGLLWSLVQPDAGFARELQLFFLGCVLVAALFGALTVKRAILFIQGGPALVALILLFWK